MEITKELVYFKNCDFLCVHTYSALSIPALAKVDLFQTHCFVFPFCDRTVMAKSDVE